MPTCPPRPSLSLGNKLAMPIKAHIHPSRGWTPTATHSHTHTHVRAPTHSATRACLLIPATYTYMRLVAYSTHLDTAPGALCTTDIPHILRHAGVGELSLRRAPNLGKLPRAIRIPAPGPISSSLALTRSHLVAYVVLQHDKYT